MGAEHKFDLTSDVTHLLIGAIDTPKYRYVAKERPDVKVLKPDWVDAVREQWLLGEDVDVAALEEEWRAPPFFGLKICLTGFEELTERNAIAELVQAHGAQYSGDLTRDITHLIAAVPKGKKYEYARSWDIKVVGLEWVRDCIERRLALDEALYDPVMPPEERGRNAWRREPIQPVTGKHPRQDDTQAQPDSRRRKLRRTVSEKFESQNDAIWADITSASAEKDQADEWEDDLDKPLKNEAEGQHVPNKTKTSPKPKPQQQARSRQPKSKRHGIFQQRLVVLHGFEDKKIEILYRHLSSNGAIVAGGYDLDKFSAEERFDGYLVIPHDIPQAEIRDLPDIAMTQVTEFWVESCLHNKKLVDPNLDTLCQPLRHSRIDGFDGVVVCSTGFENIHLLHLSKIVSLMGATYDEFLKAKTSVLVCKSDFPNVEKVKFAVENGIAAVSLAWLEACLETGIIQQPETFIIPAVHEQTYGYKEKVVIKPRKELVKKQALKDDESDDGKVPKDAPKRRTAGFRKPRSPPPEESRLTAPTLPLQELHPHVNSPSRRSASRSLSKSNSLSPTKEPSLSVAGDATPFEETENVLRAETTSEEEQQPEPVPANSIDFNNAITALLAHKTASRPSSARDSASENDNHNTRRRRRGLLGRAYSNVSNQSSAASNQPSRHNSIAQSDVQHDNPGPATQAGQNGPEPSQALMFEDPSVQQEREQVIRKMGGKVQRSVSVAVEEPAVLRDAGSSEGGVATRVRRRAREARAGAAAGGDW